VEPEGLQSFDLTKLLNIKDTGYFRKQKQYGNDDTLALFIKSKIEIAVFKTKLQCKNETSFQIPENAIGMVYYTEKGLTIYFPFQAQNGYGNLIYGKSFTNDVDGTLIDSSN
jgi:hypothetical protein